jgi:hypothetical protein
VPLPGGLAGPVIEKVMGDGRVSAGAIADGASFVSEIFALAEL